MIANENILLTAMVFHKHSDKISLITYPQLMCRSRISRFIPSQNFSIEPYLDQGIPFIEDWSCHTKSAGESLELITCWFLDGGSDVIHEDLRK